MVKKVLLVGASGTIGQAVATELSTDCEVISANYSSGAFQVDLSCSESIAHLYQNITDIDAVVCTAARGVYFSPLAEMKKSHYIDSIQSKLLGQIDLVYQGLKYLNQDNVSFTLTTGLLNAEPIAQGTAAAMVNGAIEAFVIAAAIDMPAKQRINVVSPTLLQESVQQYQSFFPGYATVPAAQVALAYKKSIFGNQTGKIFKVGWV